MADRPPHPRVGIGRRRLLTLGAATTGAIGVGWGTDRLANARSREAVFGSEVEPFYGQHQSGIVTTPQAHAVFVALDLVPKADRATVIAIMKLWTADAARLTQRSPALADTEPELATHPARLTVTVGFGPGVFAAIGAEADRPDSVGPLPSFATDRLEPTYSAGDLLLQICGDDLLAIAHATRVLLKNVRSLATVRWTQRGFRTARGAQHSATTMRNLMGQVDGTVNPSPEARDFDSLLWDNGSRNKWFTGGTTVVIRRIRIELDRWDELDRPGREQVVGRRLDTGAPLTGTHEHDEPDFSATQGGITVIPENAHIALAHHRHDGERFLRRSYNYDDPAPPSQPSNSGLVFVSYQRDITRQFLPVQQRLADADALNPWLTPIGSAVFAIPPGIAPGEYLGHQLLERRRT